MWPFHYFSSGAMKMASYEKMSHVKELMKLKDDWMKVAVLTIHIQGMQDCLAPRQNADFTESHFNLNYLKVVRLEETSHFIPFSDK